MLNFLFRKKKIRNLLSQKNVGQFKKTLKATDLIFLGVGAIVGTGIFILPGTVAALHSGPAIIFSFIIAAIVCMLAGMCYSEFSTSIPVTGSAYIYSYVVFGEIIAWVVGWSLVLEYGLASASVAAGWSSYLLSLLEGFNIHLPKAITGPFDIENGSFINLPAIFVVLIITYLLTLGMEESAKVNKIMVFVKVSVILLFLVVGVFYVKPSNWVPFLPFGVEGIIAGSAVVVFAYLGFDAVSTAAEEVISPQRNLPIGIIGSLLVCTLLYIAVSLVLTGIAPYYQLNVSNPVSFVLQLVNHDWVAGIISFGAVAGMLTVILVMLYGTTRLLFALGRDGLIPKVMSEIHPKYKTPVKNTWMVGFTVAIFAGFIPLNHLAELVNMGTLIAFSVVSIGIVFLRKNKDISSGSFKVPLFPIIPVLSFIACLFLLTQLSMETWITGIIWFFIGLAIYFLYGKKHSTVDQ